MIINNLTNKNHLFHLKAIFENAVEITIISPYITEDPKLLCFEKLASLKKLTFVTTLKAFNKDQYSKIRYFQYLHKKLSAIGVAFTILVENSLHGKIFIAEYDNRAAKALITSANFTHNGLRLNNEWGILVTDAVEAARVKRGVIEKVFYKELDHEMLNRCMDQMAKLPLPNTSKNDIELDLTALFEYKGNFHNIPTSATYWLKPIGVSGEVISRDRLFNEVEEPLHFSKLRPKGVKIGDILICYAVGHQNILSAYRVSSGILRTGNAGDRWPNYILGENLTPLYGGQWMHHNIKTGIERKDFLDKGLSNITPSGKNSYGSLNRGADKLRITTEFGEYLLHKIARINKQISEQI